MLNQITPFKNRQIKYNKPVFIYRNLVRKGHVYSIMQNNIVVAHTTHIYLINCKFFIRGYGKLKAIKTNQRNVHAFIFGFISLEPQSIDFTNKITYYPFNNDGFTSIDSNQNKFEVKNSKFILIDNEGVKGFGINKLENIL